MPFRLRNPAQIRRAASLAALAAAACLNSVIAASSVQPSAEEREGIIFERQQTMLQLDRDAETLGRIVAGITPPDRLKEVTAAIAKGARDSLQDFQNRVPGGRSKPEVWSNSADFKARMEAFARNADAMARAGETGNVTAVTERMIDAMPCKQCHDLYREPKKP
jgi:cytochrome c556